MRDIGNWIIASRDKSSSIKKKAITATNRGTLDEIVSYPTSDRIGLTFSSPKEITCVEAIHVENNHNIRANVKDEVTYQTEQIRCWGIKQDSNNTRTTPTPSYL